MKTDLEIVPTDSCASAATSADGASVAIVRVSGKMPPGERKDASREASKLRGFAQ